MDNRTRFHNLMRFQPVDRLPLLEWATWWDKTITRWRGEGLPESLTDPGEIREYFGQDVYRQTWLGPLKSSFTHPGIYAPGRVTTMDDYLAVKEHLYPDPCSVMDRSLLEGYAQRQATGEMVVWLTLNGFFWFPRTLFGIEGHLFAFYEQPEVIHAINRDLLEHNLKAVDAFCQIITPDFVTFAEDMSFHTGPMISKALFDEFIAPYYRRLTPKLLERDIIPIIDSDGNVHQLIPWFLEAGVDGFLPLERRAGCDPVLLRERHPHIRIIGAFDKTVMSLGEDAMRAEFERLLPVMKQGGFIPGVDHQTPPDVSLDTYRVYTRLLKEYCVKAVQ